MSSVGELGGAARRESVPDPGDLTRRLTPWSHLSAAGPAGTSRSGIAATQNAEVGYALKTFDTVDRLDDLDDLDEGDPHLVTFGVPL